MNSQPQFIRFDQITLEYLELNLTEQLRLTQQVVSDLEQQTLSSWATIMQPLQHQLYKLGQIWSLISHLQSVKDTPQLRELHERFLPQVTALYVNLGQNQSLYNHMRTIHATSYINLSAEQRRILDNELRDFKLSGINLASAEQQQYKQIQEQLSELSTKFEHNVLDATDSYAKYVTEDCLVGVPAENLELYKTLATKAGQDGYKISLHMPSYLPIMQYAAKRSLREELYHAYVTRASEFDQQAKYDNQPLIRQILQLRQAKARLLGFNNYAELSLVTKMADSPSEVLSFLEDLASKSRAYALKDLSELEQFAREVDGIDKLEAWDIAYYSEKLQQQRYSYSSNELKQYFQLPKVVNGLFNLVQNLYQIEFKLNKEMPTWDEHCIAYDVVLHEQIIGHIYFDLYARDGKQPGAWMNSAQDRDTTQSPPRLPIAYIICNFTPPVATKPALLTFDEVQTLFHEMGHALHHLLTTVNYASIAGINGVEWDAVELPSQFMEYFTWDYAHLSSLTAHITSGEILPRQLFERVLASRYYQSGLHMLRQLEFAIFDLYLHSQFNPDQDDYLALLAKVRDQVAVIVPPSYNRFPNSFAHIFAGGYASGYYSYKWAEVLACDVFSVFDGQSGSNLARLGARFQETILSRGGLYPMLDNFKQFMGREPQVAALLKYSGMA